MRCPHLPHAEGMLQKKSSREYSVMSTRSKYQQNIFRGNKSICGHSFSSGRGGGGSTLGKCV